MSMDCDASNLDNLPPENRNQTMLSWALTLFIIAIIAGVLGLSGVAGAASNIAWILFVIGIILAIIFLISGRRPSV
jgi:uncharacterized membrane protein YtjA (UPF0391 family)